jgi:hypothetical protein
MKLRIEIDTDNLPSVGTPVTKMTETGCPIEIEDMAVNEENHDHAVEEYNYSPATDAEVTCGTCAAFDQSTPMMVCISRTSDDTSLGFCQKLKFMCSQENTCSMWVEGGPITDEAFDDHGDIL